MTTEQEVKATLERATATRDDLAHGWFTERTSDHALGILLWDLVQLVESLGDKSIARTGEPLGERDSVAQARKQALEEAAKVALHNNGPERPTLTESDPLFSKPPAFIFGYAYAAGQNAQSVHIYEAIRALAMGAAPITRESNPAQQEPEAARPGAGEVGSNLHRKGGGRIADESVGTPAVAGPRAVKEAQWVSVPLEPTEEMIDAAKQLEPYGEWYPSTSIYKAMLAARDKPQPHEEG